MRISQAIFALGAMAAPLVAQPPSPQYAEGQVWEYKTRPGDEGSLLKIQKIEDLLDSRERGPVYHISVIGFHLTNTQMQPVLPHAPVSKATLDASVVRLSSSSPAFPDAADGIAQWRQANGGIFTIPVAAVIDTIDQTTRSVGQQ